MNEKGYKIPEDLKEILQKAPPEIRRMLEKAILRGNKVQVIDMTGDDEEKPKETSPNGADRSKRSALNSLLNLLKNRPDPIELLKMAVTRVMAEDRQDCSLCTILTMEPGKPPIAKCLEDMTAPEMLIQAAMKLMDDMPLVKRVKAIAKVLDTTPEGLVEIVKDVVARSE